MRRWAALRPLWSLRSDHFEDAIRRWGQLDLDRIARTQVATSEHNAHYTRLPHELTMGVTGEYGREQPRLKLVQLRAGVAEPGKLDDDASPEVESRADRERKQVESTGRHILAQVTRTDGETCRAQLVMQFGVDEVHLSEIGLCRVPRHPRAMPDGRPLMGVSLDASTGKEPDARLRDFTE